MRRLLNTRFLALFALVVSLAPAGLTAAQTPTPTSTPTPMDQRQSQESLLPALQGVPRGERFDHFRGGQFTVADAQGNTVTYQLTFGTVASITDNTVAVTPFGATNAVNFSITSETDVLTMPEEGSLQAITQGDKVMVVSQQGAQGAMNAVIITVHDQRSRFHHMMGPGKF